MKITKQEVKEKSKKLSTKWTVTLECGDGSVSADLEEEVAKILQEEIDWEIMMDMLTQLSWTKVQVDFPERMAENDAHQIKEWCRANLHGNYKGRANIWLFELQEDAVMFTLKWS